MSNLFHAEDFFISLISKGYCCISQIVIWRNDKSNIFLLYLCFCIICPPDSGRGRGRGRRGPNSQSLQRPSGPQQTPGGRRIRSELKSKEQILKQRKKRDKQQFLQGGGMQKLRAKNKQWLSEVKKSGFGRGGQKKGKMKKKLWGGHEGIRFAASRYLLKNHLQ